MGFVSDMHPEARAAFARLAYERAVSAARAVPTPHAWARLLTAARNVRAAADDTARLRGGAPARGHATTGHGGGGAVLRLPLPPARAPWPEVVREWERARTLIEWSRRLVEQSRALAAELAAAAGRS